MFELGFRSTHDIAVIVFAAGLMFASFAVAHVFAIAFPAVDGKARKATLMASRICLFVLFVSAIWFVYAAFDYLRLFDVFNGSKG